MKMKSIVSFTTFGDLAKSSLESAEVFRTPGTLPGSNHEAQKRTKLMQAFGKRTRTRKKAEWAILCSVDVRHSRQFWAWLAQEVAHRLLFVLPVVWLAEGLLCCVQLNKMG